MFANFVTRQCRKSTFEENVVLKLKNGTDVIRLAADGLTAGPNRRTGCTVVNCTPPHPLPNVNRFGLAVRR